MAAQYPSNQAPQFVVQSGQPAASVIQAPAQYPGTGTAVIQSPNSSENYNAKSARVTGGMQLACAISCIVLGIIQLIIGSSVGYVGTGVWSGLLLILPTGILGIVSRKKNTCVIVAYMVMSIISAIAGFVVMTMGCVAAGVSSDQYCTHYSCGLSARHTRIAFDSLLAITGLVELVVAIVAACYCCAGVCCGRNPSTTTTMVYTYQNTATPMVMMVPNYGQPVGGQPMPMGYVGQQPPQTNQPQGTYPAPAAYPQPNYAPAPQPNMTIQAPPLYSEIAAAPSQDLPPPGKM